jgi:hypothetical protein
MAEDRRMQRSGFPISHQNARDRETIQVRWHGASSESYCGFGAGLTGVPSRRLSGSSRCARPKLSYARMTRCTR